MLDKLLIVLVIWLLIGFIWAIGVMTGVWG